MVLAIIVLMLLLLAAVIFSTGGIGLFGPGKEYAPRDAFYTSSVGTVGESKGTFRHITIGSARIGLFKEVSPAAEVDGPAPVARGILTAEDYVIRIPKGKIKGDALLDFDVLSTNGAGTLMVWVNGALAWSGMPDAGDRIELRFKPAAENTDIKFSVTSSGLRFWLPSAYEIEKISVREDEQVKMRQAFDFEVTAAEVDDWSIGRAVFQITDASPQASVPNLVIKVNNATIFAGKPAIGNLPVQVDFGKASTAIREGNNTLSFEVAGEGQYDIAGIELIIFSNVEGRREPSFRFDVTQDEIDGLREGALNGAVTFKMLSPGTLSVSIRAQMGGGEKVLLRDAWSDIGTVDLPFDWQAVNPGANSLLFNVSGGHGPVSIGNLWVKLYK